MEALEKQSIISIQNKSDEERTIRQRNQIHALRLTHDVHWSVCDLQCLSEQAKYLALFSISYWDCHLFFSCVFYVQRNQNINRRTISS